MKQARAFVLTGGKVVTRAGVAPGAVRCLDGRIAAVGDVALQDGDEVVDAGGLLVAPGLVDFGVFAIDKPAFHFGGITRAALMPDQSPPLDHPARVMPPKWNAGLSIANTPKSTRPGAISRPPASTISSPSCAATAPTASTRPSTQRTAPGATPAGVTTLPPVRISARSCFMPSPPRRAPCG